jgi:hypothetical protein
MFHVEIRSSQTWALCAQCAALLRILLLVGRFGDNSELVRDSTKPSDLLMESQNLRTRWVSERGPASQETWEIWMEVHAVCVLKKKELQFIIPCSVADPGCLSGTPPPTPRIQIFFPFRTSDPGSNNNNNRSKKINYSCRSIKRFRISDTANIGITGI